MEDYTYDELVTFVTLTDKQGRTYTEEWCGELDSDDIVFAKQKLCLDYDIAEQDVESYTIDEQVVIRDLRPPEEELYGTGNVWSSSGDYYSNSDWSYSQLYR